MDRAAHLEHLHIVLREFDANVVISEPVLIRLFCDGLRLSIRAQAEKKDCQKKTWNQAIRKAITAKIQAALNLLFWVCEMDARCPQGHYSTSKHIKDPTRD